MADPVRTSIQDIARRVDAPLDQVVKVILGQPDVGEELRRKVFRVMQDAGLIRIPRDMAEGTIGVVIPRTVIDDYIGEVARGITETARQHNYAVEINVQSLTRGDDLLHLLGTGGCNGVIPVVPLTNYERLLELCKEYQRAYVLVDYQGDDDIADVPAVGVKNQQSMVGVMYHLFDFGHRRIGFITGRLQHASARQRQAGYEQALSEAGIPFDPVLVLEGNWEHPSGYEAARKLLQLDERPTAIVASNDLMAFGVIQAARQAGLEIPADLSITGFDDIKMAATVTPPLTTVRQPMYQLGAAAAELLLKRIRGEPLEQMHVELDTQLIIRDSTGPAPNR